MRVWIPIALDRRAHCKFFGCSFPDPEAGAPPTFKSKPQRAQPVSRCGVPKADGGGGKDSNLRYGRPYNPSRMRCFKPLSHPSVTETKCTRKIQKMKPSSLIDLDAERYRKPDDKFV